MDDEPAILGSLKEQLLRCFGDRYLYEMATSTAEAGEIVRELSNDGVELLLVVSDWLVPGARGDEFLIQVHQRFPRIVTVLLAGQADAAAIARAQYDAKLHRCLYKPWTEAELADAIVSGLEAKPA